MEETSYLFLTTLLNTFRNAAETGMTNLSAPALGLATVLGIIDITAMWGLYFGEMRVREIIGKAIKIGFFVLLIINWYPLTTAVEATFVKVANIAATNSSPPKTSQDIMILGTKKMYRLWNNAIYDIPMDGVVTAKDHEGESYYDADGKLRADHATLTEESKDSNPFSGLGAAMAAIPGRIVKILLALVIFIAFAFIALNVLLCNIEFLIVTTLSIILLPFGVNSHTSFISQKALGAVVNFGVKLMVMFFLLGLTMKGIEGMSTIANDDYGKLFEAVLESVMYAFLIWTMPSLISGMLSGTPSMGASAGAVAGAARGAVGGVAGTVTGAAASGARGMYNAAKIGGDAIRAGRAAGGIRAGLSAASQHLTGTTKDVAKHRINRAKNLFLSGHKGISNRARILSNTRAKNNGYGK